MGMWVWALCASISPWAWITKLGPHKHKGLSGDDMCTRHIVPSLNIYAERKLYSKPTSPHTLFFLPTPLEKKQKQSSL